MNIMLLIAQLCMHQVPSKALVGLTGNLNDGLEVFKKLKLFFCGVVYGWFIPLYWEQLTTEGHKLFTNYNKLGNVLFVNANTKKEIN